MNLYVNSVPLSKIDQSMKEINLDVLDSYIIHIIEYNLRFQKLAKVFESRILNNDFRFWERKLSKIYYVILTYLGLLFSPINFKNLATYFVNNLN